MTRWMKPLVIAAAAVIVLTAAGLLLYRHFVSGRIMDRGGMENPDASGRTGNEVHALDGAYTCVDNEALLRVITGTWESSVGGWRMTLTDGCRITLTLDGETVLAGKISFTHLQPEKAADTKFSLDSGELKGSDGTVLGEIQSLCHRSGAESGSMVLQVLYHSGNAETFELVKSEEKDP